MTWPSLEEFRELARDRRVIPVVRRLLADAETPIGLYRKLARDQPGTFLLESAEHGGVWSRYSIVGARCRAVLTERDGEATWIGEPPVGVPTSGDPLVALQLHRRGTAHPGDPWPATPDRRHGRCDHLRRGPPLGAAARRHRRRPPACPS